MNQGDGLLRDTIGQIYMAYSLKTISLITMSVETAICKQYCRNVITCTNRYLH